MQLLRTKVKVPAEKIMIIRGSGVDTDLFQPVPEPEGVPVVLLASRMLRIKGIEEFVEAAKRVQARGTVARFVLAGDTDASNPSCIPRSQIVEWQRAGIIEWWGHQDDMAQAFKQANLVCLPSHGGEGIPQVLLEAAASARAIVTTDVPGCHDIVRHGINGMIVPRCDPGGLAQAIEDLLQDPALRKRMAGQSREIVVREFSQRAVVRQVMALYSELLVSQTRIEAVASTTSDL